MQWLYKMFSMHVEISGEQKGKHSLFIKSPAVILLKKMEKMGGEVTQKWSSLRNKHCEVLVSCSDRMAVKSCH